MIKDELLAELEKARRTEEVMLLYTRHIKNTLYLSGFKKDVRNKIKETLDTLHREGSVHKIFIRQLIDKVKEGEQNVY